MKLAAYCLFPWWFPLAALAADHAANPTAVPTFECLGLYWKTPDGAVGQVCEVSYRATGDPGWRSALPLWFDARDQEYRGSLVHLQPGTTYEVALQLKGKPTRAALQARTWSESFPVGKTVTLPARRSEPLTITESGSPEGYAVYAPATQAEGAVVDVAGKADHCMVVKASYLILRGLTLQNARIHGVLLGEGVHDVVIEECDISGWGRVAEDGWGKDYDAAIYSRSEAVKRIIVQRNRIHHPRSNSNNWQQSRPAPGKREPSHPEGPQAVCLWDSEGNHVIRYNTVFSDDTHQYNDIFGAGHNFSRRGFPNRDSDLYGNLLSHCWDDAIESEGANCNVRIWGNYLTDVYVGVASASTSLGPLYVWRNVTGVVRESPAKISGAFFKTSDKMGGGKIYVFHNTILQPVNPNRTNQTMGAVVGLGWGGPMTNVTSRNNILHATRQAFSDRTRDPQNDFDFDLFSAPFTAANGQEQHGLHGVPVFVADCGLREGKGIFALSSQSPGFDAGVVLPNFNTPFIGGAPDLGAHEAGSAPMEFGLSAYRSAPRPRAESKSTEMPQLAVYRWANQAINVDAFEKWLGGPRVWAEDFVGSETWNNVAWPVWWLEGWSKWKRAQPGRRLILSLPLLPGPWDGTGPKQGDAAGERVSLEDGAAGKYNHRFKTLAENLVKHQLADTILRLGWEFNGGWYAWRAKGKEPAFAEYWRQIVKTMRAVPGAGPLQFCWNPALGYQQFPSEQAWPGDEFVDFVGVDVYDESWMKDTYPWPAGASEAEITARRRKVWNDQILRGNHGLVFWSQFARAHRKPLAIPEWGVNNRVDMKEQHGGLDNAFFIEQMHRFITDPANHVAFHCYFDVQAPDGHHQLSPGPSGAEKTEFPLAAARFKELFGAPLAGGGPPAPPSANRLDRNPALPAKFTFGTPASVTRAGFTKVTVKDQFTPERGFGFEATDGLLAFDRGGWEIARPKDEYTASVYGAYRTTSDLTCALVEGTNDNAFLAALPDGDYTVWLVASDAECDPPLFEVWANGLKKLEVRIPRRAFVFMESFQARAAGGQLRIELKGLHGWVLNGLVIGKEGPELAEAVARLERDIFFLTEPELPKWKEVKPTPANPPLAWTPEERTRGYVTFPVDYTEQIAPAHLPTRTAIGKPMTALATLDEFEPATFCISAQRDLGKVIVELSEFVGENGPGRIARDSVSVGIVRCWPQRVSGWGGNGEYRVVPEMIEPPVGRACRVQAGQLKQWWLTVHVPPDAAAGRYRMSFTVRPEKAPPTVVEWRLLVLPFRLSRPADKHWGTWLDSFPPVGSLWGPERRGRKVPVEIERLAQADIADYRAHGFDLVLLNYYFGAKENPDGSFTYGLATLPQDLERLKGLDSGAPVVLCFEYTCRNWEYQFAEPGKQHVPGTFSPKARKAIVGLVQHLRDEARRRHWPKLYFFPIDEPGNNKTENRYLFAENVLDFVHEVPGCPTAVTVTSGCVQRLGNRVDARIYAYGHYQRDKVLLETKQGHPFWYYENGMFYGHSTSASRNLAGFQFLRSGAEVATAWGFAATQANPYNDFDGGHKDWNVIFPGVDRPTPTIYWELCREGVDDCRYAATLQEHIGQAKQRGQLAAAQRAERVLAPLLAADAPEISQCAAFGRYRWRMAREILALRGDRPFALPFTAAPDNPPSPIRLGPNLVENPSFEDPPQPDSSPRGRYALGYPNAKEKPAGALTVTDEAAHSGRSSLKWDLSQVAGVESTRRNPRWLTVNVTWPSDTVKRLRGQRVRIGYWMRLGAGTTVPGLQLRQNLKDQPGERFSYSGGVADPAVWNHFETEGRLSPDLESMDIHTWCAIPEPELAKKSYFYMDDVSLQVIEEPPLVISTPVDEYYIGETIPWMVTTTTTNGLLALALLGGDHLIAEQTLPMAATTLRGAFTTGGLKPGFYTLVAKTGGDAGLPPPTIRRQVIVAPDPFNW